MNQLMHLPEMSGEKVKPAVVVQAQADSIDQAIALINQSRRRVILAGGGIALSGAASELQALAEKIDAPVITTSNGKGVLRDDHPLYAGPVLMTAPGDKLWFPCRQFCT